MVPDAIPDPSEVVDGVLHEDTQFVGETVHLSVDEVREVVEPGRVDFGGGELEPAETRPVPTAKRNPDDDYEWWTLPQGTYLLAYNEALRGRDDPVRLEPRPALLQRGGLPPVGDGAGPPGGPPPGRPVRARAEGERPRHGAPDRLRV